MERIPIHIFRFILLAFIQIFLLKNIGYYNLATPFLYVLFILLLPFKTPNWLVYLLAFCMGLTIDTFYDTLGLHALACTFMAWARIIFISITVSTEDRETEPQPGMSEMGFRWFLIYSLTLIFVHHLALFSFEIFRLSGFGEALLSTLLSTIFTLFLVLLSQFVFYRKKSR